MDLEAYPTTGYVWQLDPPVHGLQLVDEEHLAPATALPGAAGRQRFTLRALALGQMTLRLVLKRPWETEPIEEKIFLVRVHKP